MEVSLFPYLLVVVNQSLNHFRNILLAILIGLVLLCITILSIHPVYEPVVNSRTAAIHGVRQDNNCLLRNSPCKFDPKGSLLIPRVESPDTKSYLGGYASKVSVAQGERIALYVSTDLAAYALNIWREGSTRQLMTTTNVLTGGLYSCLNGYQPPGCGWPPVYTLTVPIDWSSGVYVVDVPTSSQETRHIIFWVRENKLGSTTPILFLASVNTYQAYNSFGGKSMYSYNSIGEAAYRLSFNRPYHSRGLGDFYREKPLIRWAEGNSYILEYAAESDLELIPDLLDAYEVVVIAGHSEYWTWNMRQRMKAFIKKGGRLINLSGNTMWWQVRYEDEGRTLVGYKKDAYSKDPKYPSHQDNTSNPWMPPIYDPESTITGVQWRFGGYFNSPHGSSFKHQDGYGGFWIQRSDHWIFDGTDVEGGSILGRTETKSIFFRSTEADGTSFNCTPNGKKILGPLANTGTPNNFTILGIAPVSTEGTARAAQLGFAVMGIYTTPGGGAVFSAGTTDWTTALDHDPQLARVTRNIFDHFLANDFPAEPISSIDTNYLFYDRFNCTNLSHDGLLVTDTVPAWYRGVTYHNYSNFFGNPDNLRYTSDCGVEGAGLRIEIDANDWISYQSQLEPNWGGTDVLYTRMYVDLSNLVMGEYDQFVLLSLINQSSKTQSRQAGLRVYHELGQTNLIYEDPKNRNPLVVPVPDIQPFLIETMWDRPQNRISLWVNGIRYDKYVALSRYQPINRVDLMLEGWELGKTNGHVCVDELTFDDERIGPLAPGVTLASNRDVQISPGSKMVLTYTVTNSGTMFDSYVVTSNLELANGLVTTTPINIKALAPTESTVFAVTIQTAMSIADTLTGTVTTVATSQADSNIRDVATNRVTITRNEGESNNSDPIISNSLEQ